MLWPHLDISHGELFSYRTYPSLYQQVPYKTANPLPDLFWHNASKSELLTHIWSS